MIPAGRTLAGAIPAGGGTRPRGTTAAIPEGEQKWGGGASVAAGPSPLIDDWCWDVAPPWPYVALTEMGDDISVELRIVLRRASTGVLPATASAAENWRCSVEVLVERR